MKTLAGTRPRWGYRRLHILLAREGVRVNWKRVYRVYREECLTVRRRRRKHVAVPREPMPTPQQMKQRWSMDFVHDMLQNGRRIRMLNVVDDCTRECLAIETDTSLPGARGIAVLERLSELRGLPRASAGRRALRQAWEAGHGVLLREAGSRRFTKPLFLTR